MGEILFKARKSYLLMVGYEAETVLSVTEMGKKLGFIPVSVASVAEAQSYFIQITHCVAVFAHSKLSDSEKVALNDMVADAHLHVKVSDLSQGGTREIEAFLDSLFPEKMKELCEFGLNRIIPNLIPDLNPKWGRLDKESAEVQPDFLISCETIGDTFLGAISIKGRFESLQASSKILESMTNEEVLNFCAEIGNEVLGVVNFNLLKIRISSQVTLPLIVRDLDQGIFRKRASYFLPAFHLRDAGSGLQISFQFLVPFLRNADVDRTMKFEVGMEQAIELF